MPNVPENFAGVTVVTKANVYFDGRVVSHTILLPDGTRKTIGLIFPGEYRFTTQTPEWMQVVAGECAVRLDGSQARTEYAAGNEFNVPGQSGFTIEVRSGICEYVCTFLK